MKPPRLQPASDQIEMKLEQIITLASAGVRLPFNVMERSLRATGCDLPLRVIPFNEDRFELPPNANWWVVPEVREWVNRCDASPRAKGVMHKYQTLLIGNYLFVDSDVVFLRDPREVFSEVGGFVTCCGHWHNPGHTYTRDSLALMRRASTVWQSRVFNSGQFACDRALYDFNELRTTAESEELKATCLGNRFHEQPGMNALVFVSGVEVSNLTLPPIRLESSWAGDYVGPDYARYWQDRRRMPCFLHWAGRKPTGSTPVDELFLRRLEPAERSLWLASNRTASPSLVERLKRMARDLRK